MPCKPEKVPKRLSATTMAQRSVAQYGQYSAPMYSTSGLPLAVSGVPEMEVTDFAYAVPGPTAVSVLAGTVVRFLTTLGGRAVALAELAELDAGLLVALMTMKATTTTTTARMLPAVMKTRLRISARCAAARCAAIFSRAFSRLILVALLIACPMNGCRRSPAAVHRRALHLMKASRWCVGGVQ